MIKTVHHALYTECSPQWSWSVESLPDYDLWYVAAGRGTMKVDGLELDLREDTVLLLAPGSRISAAQNLEHRMKVYAVHFMGEVQDFPENRPFLLQHTALVQGLFQRLVTEQEGTDVNRKIWLTALFLELQTRYRDRNRTHENTSPYSSKLRQLARDISLSPRSDWSLDKMAGALAVCPDHFLRLFKEEFGRTPGQYLLDARIRMARDLLKESDETVAGVAELSGFKSSPWFCRYFKARTGLTPGQFRKGDLILPV